MRFAFSALEKPYGKFCLGSGMAIEKQDGFPHSRFWMALILPLQQKQQKMMVKALSFIFSLWWLGFPALDTKNDSGGVAARLKNGSKKVLFRGNFPQFPWVWKKGVLKMKRVWGLGFGSGFHRRGGWISIGGGVKGFQLSEG